MRLDADSARRCWEPIWLRRDFVGRIPDLCLVNHYWKTLYASVPVPCVLERLGHGGVHMEGKGMVPLRYDVIRCWTGWFYAYFGRGISLNCA
ncbi:hypothetical protein HBH79_240990 [Parastagonospora nodorum]|nr:hypothetical protein HBI01_224720 [Parastagonospora nodorum]KAH4304757.1 hypothetical protein HBI02_123700 [Parastagonospora nodorum]KAH4323784.1 hypothetical protein HBI00_178470 [Parastagonospora nodorum]KAH4367708.1 hypothetical protein HBH94_136660 [Parastagonospora nodorum]KAH4479471.1 hypothetical protein HBH88_188070 [Parastagonospora nodorum]